jgi:hypothetical protein
VCVDEVAIDVELADLMEQVGVDAIEVVQRDIGPRWQGEQEQRRKDRPNKH